MKCPLFFLLLIINSTCLLSQIKLKKDTTYLAPRSFDKVALQELKGSKDFQYNNATEPVPSLWSKFWAWLWWQINQLLSTKSGRVTFWSVLVMFGIAGIIFFIVKVTGMDQGGLFGRSSKGHQKYSLSQNDIHLISFEDAIEKAIIDGNFRLATRLQYLQALKRLSDKGYIDWRINKTNTDYLAEIKGNPFSDMFTRLTFSFEYTWYGEKQVSKEEFLEIRRQFQQFNNQVL